MNRRGYYFTLTVLIIMGLVVVFFSSFSDPGYSRQGDLTAERLAQVNTYLHTVQVDAHTALRVAAIRSFLSAEAEFIRSNGDYFDDEDELEEVLTELITIGTWDEGAHTSTFMDESTLSEWEDKITALSQEYDLDVDVLGWGQVSVWQVDPWHVQVSIPYTLRAVDSFSDSHWELASQAVASISIEKFLDPVFTVETDQLYYQSFKRANVTDFPNNLTELIANRMYIASPFSPSFLDRYTGKLSTHTAGDNLHGIESLIDVPNLVDYGIYPLRSINDYLYLTSGGPGWCNVGLPPSAPSFVKVSRTYPELYGLSCPAPPPPGHGTGMGT